VEEERKWVTYFESLLKSNRCSLRSSNSSILILFLSAMLREEFCDSKRRNACNLRYQLAFLATRTAPNSLFASQPFDVRLVFTVQINLEHDDISPLVDDIEKVFELRSAHVSVNFAVFEVMLYRELTFRLSDLVPSSSLS
jgi:hypothetical protein